MITTEREVTAIHEAGHCLIAERLGYRIKKAWISTANDENGTFKLELKSVIRRFIRSFLNSEENVMMIIGGNEAQLQFFPNSKILPSDDRDLTRISRCVDVDINKSKQSLQKILSEGRNLTAIKQIARILDKEGKITGQEVRTIISRIDSASH